MNENLIQVPSFLNSNSSVSNYSLDCQASQYTRDTCGMCMDSCEGGGCQYCEGCLYACQSQGGCSSCQKTCQGACESACQNACENAAQCGIYAGVNGSVQRITNLRCGKAGAKHIITQAYAGVDGTPQLVYDFLNEIDCMVIVLNQAMNRTVAEDTNGDGLIDKSTFAGPQSKENWQCNTSITNPTANNKYQTNLSFSLKTTLGGSLLSYVYFQLKTGEYIAFNDLFSYLSQRDFTFYTYFSMSWNGYNNAYRIDFCGFTPWNSTLSGTSFSKPTNHTIADFSDHNFFMEGYKSTSISVTFNNLTINNNKYPIIILDKIKYSDTDQFFWVNNRCYAFSPGMTWTDFINNSSYDKEGLFAKYTTKNLIKYTGCLESGTYYIKDQALSDTIQATTYELMNANELLSTGTYWVIDQNGTTTYDSSGVAYEYSNNTSSWTCPIKGTYEFELHGKGGDGGTGIANYHMVHNITYDYGSERMAGAGGGGGGSGVRYSSISLIEKDNFTITWDGGVTTLVGASKTYSCNPGTNGSNGTAKEPWSSYIVATGGSGGARATYAPGGANLASAGSRGGSEWRYGNSGATGGAGGSGGATVGSYGNGGNGADVPGGTYWSWEYNQVESETYNGTQGQPGAIIITYQR